MLIRVIKPFLVKGQRQEPGSVVDLPDQGAREILWMGKAELVADEPVVPAVEAPDQPFNEMAPMTTDDMPTAVSTKRRGRPRRADT